MDSESTSSPADTWRERIVAQQAGGQSIRAWCRDNGCHEHSFYWWRVRLNLSPVGVKRRRRSSSKPITFTEVTVGRPTAEPMCLRLARGRELLLPASMPVEKIAGLVGLIEALP
jgi:hypothetical protein